MKVLQFNNSLRIVIMLCLFCFPFLIYGQGVVITEEAGATIPDASSILDVRSTDKGMLVPRLTTAQRQAIVSPANGLLVYDTDKNSFYYYDATRVGWVGVVNYDPQPAEDEPLFVVRNSEDKIVFAVYEKGVRMYVEDDAKEPKGNKSGFAIGGLTGFKDNETEYFRVTPDSVRIFLREPKEKGNKGGFAIGGLTGFKADTVALMFVAPDSTRFYIDTEAATGGGKGNKGGFAIGGLTGFKNLPEEYLRVTRDSTRVYFSTEIQPDKGNKSGFAIGGLTGFKGEELPSFFNVSADTTGVIDPSEARILWYPSKNAFMTGQVLIEKPDSIGKNSFSSGFESKAIGNWSQALGYEAIARGDYSTAIGKNAIANGESSFAFGDNSIAGEKGDVANNSFAFGEGAMAIGQGSYAFGSLGRDTTNFNSTLVKTLAEGEFSFAIGLGAEALGHISMAMGNSTIAQGKNSLALGAYSQATGGYSTVWGRENIASGTISTSFGYKTLASAWTSTAFGQETQATGMWATAFGYQTKASANYATAFGKESEASGEYSTAFGNYTKASGNSALAFGASVQATGSFAAAAIGYLSVASGNNSLSMGYDNLASNEGAVAIGRQNIASGIRASALGYFSQATGSYSTAIGQNLEALSGYEVVVGRYNTLYTPASSTGWNASDRLFVVGNGTGTTTRSNAMIIFKNGNVGFTEKVSAGTTTSFPTNLTAYGSMQNPSIPNTSSTGVFRVATGSSQGIDFGKMGTGSFAAWMQVGYSGYTDPLSIQPLGGNVGIGTNNPISLFHIAGAETATDGETGIFMDIQNTVGTTTGRLLGVRFNHSTGVPKAAIFYRRNLTNGRGDMVFAINNVDDATTKVNYTDAAMVITRTKNVGIGTNAPGRILHVKQNAIHRAIRMEHQTTADYWEVGVADASKAFRFDYNGTNKAYIAIADGTYYTASDLRLKKDIEPLENSLQKVLKLKPSKFFFKDSESSTKSIGFISQDVEKLFPELVSISEEGYKFLSYNEFSVIAIKAIQEQQEYIQQLEDRLERLERLMLEKK